MPMSKRKKREDGEGCVFRKRDDLWGAYIVGEDGKRKYFYAKSKQKVLEKLEAAREEKKRGMLVFAPRQTVAEYLASWLEHGVKGVVRSRTYERYEECVRLHIVPAIGRVKLQSLTPDHVKALKSKKLKEGLSATTVSTILIVLHKALSDAVKEGLIGRNICDMVSLPHKQHKELQVLTSEQAKKFLDAAKGHPNEALFVLALATGMRRGELLGLKWQDIDFSGGVLHVRRVLSRVPTIMGEGAGSLVESEPKTRQSRRSIVLAGFALDALRKHKQLQDDWQKEAGDSWEGRDYVFCTPLGRGIHPNTLRKQFIALVEKAGVPAIRFHDLRHSVASLLLMRGVHPKVVQEILGHSQISITMDIYSHVLPIMHQDAMDQLHQAFAEQDEGDDDEGGGVLART